MKNYAQLNENQICVGLTQAEGLIISTDVIEIEDYDISLLGSKYNNGAWEIIEPETPQEPIPTPLEAISEQLKALSEKYENDQSYTQEMMLTLASAIAEVYERLDAEASK